MPNLMLIFLFSLLMILNIRWFNNMELVMDSTIFNALCILTGMNISFLIFGLADSLCRIHEDYKNKK